MLKSINVFICEVVLCAYLLITSIMYGRIAQLEYDIQKYNPSVPKFQISSVDKFISSLKWPIMLFEDEVNLLKITCNEESGCETTKS